MASTHACTTYIYIYGLSRLAERAKTNRCRLAERAKTNRCNHPITNICIETAWSAAQNSFCNATADFLCCQGRLCTARADLEGQTLTFHQAVGDGVVKPGPATSFPAEGLGVHEYCQNRPCTTKADFAMHTITRALYCIDAYAQSAARRNATVHQKCGGPKTKRPLL